MKKKINEYIFRVSLILTGYFLIESFISTSPLFLVVDTANGKEVVLQTYDVYIYIIKYVVILSGLFLSYLGMSVKLFKNESDDSNQIR